MILKDKDKSKRYRKESNTVLKKSELWNIFESEVKKEPLECLYRNTNVVAGDREKCEC
jgi:hypothetical protein